MTSKAAGTAMAGDASIDWGAISDAFGGPPGADDAAAALAAAAHASTTRDADFPAITVLGSAGAVDLDAAPRRTAPAPSPTLPREHGPSGGGGGGGTRGTSQVDADRAEMIASMGGLRLQGAPAASVLVGRAGASPGAAGGRLGSAYPSGVNAVEMAAVDAATRRLHVAAGAGARGAAGADAAASAHDASPHAGVSLGIDSEAAPGEVRESLRSMARSMAAEAQSQRQAVFSRGAPTSASLAASRRMATGRSSAGVSISTAAPASAGLATASDAEGAGRGGGGERAPGSADWVAAIAARIQADEAAASAAAGAGGDGGDPSTALGGGSLRLPATAPSAHDAANRAGRYGGVAKHSPDADSKELEEKPGAVGTADDASAASPPPGAVSASADGGDGGVVEVTEIEEIQTPEAAAARRAEAAAAAAERAAAAAAAAEVAAATAATPTAAPAPDAGSGGGGGGSSAGRGQVRLGKPVGGHSDSKADATEAAEAELAARRGAPIGVAPPASASSSSSSSSLAPRVRPLLSQESYAEFLEMFPDLEEGGVVDVRTLLTGAVDVEQALVTGAQARAEAAASVRANGGRDAAGAGTGAGAGAAGASAGSAAIARGSGADGTAPYGHQHHQHHSGTGSDAHLSFTDVPPLVGVLGSPDEMPGIPAANPLAERDDGAAATPVIHPDSGGLMDSGFGGVYADRDFEGNVTRRGDAGVAVVGQSRNGVLSGPGAPLLPAGGAAGVGIGAGVGAAASAGAGVSGSAGRPRFPAEGSHERWADRLPDEERAAVFEKFAQLMAQRDGTEYGPGGGGGGSGGGVSGAATALPSFPMSFAAMYDAAESIASDEGDDAGAGAGAGGDGDVDGDGGGVGGGDGGSDAEDDVLVLPRGESAGRLYAASGPGGAHASPPKACEVDNFVEASDDDDGDGDGDGDGDFSSGGDGGGGVRGSPAGAYTDDALAAAVAAAAVTSAAAAAAGDGDAEAAGTPVRQFALGDDDEGSGGDFSSGGGSGGADGVVVDVSRRGVPLSVSPIAVPPPPAPAAGTR